MSVSAVLIFFGCAPNATGVCDLVSEFVVEAPDGSKTPGGCGSVWADKPKPQRLLLGQASLTMDFGPTDALGDYKITADIQDKVSGRMISVLARLRITE
jgi:hypothetical protein